jgi:predicted GH43/DUF377 family glycosyl hydrolase
MNKKELPELFRRWKGNPILTPDQWPYPVNAVFNPGAVKFKDETLLLVRVEDNQGYSHLTLARSKDGKTNWQISSEPTLQPDISFGEDLFGLEDPRITWIKEREEYIITYVSFFANVAGEPPGISLISTKDFSKFERLGRQLMPPNKDACLFPKTIRGHYALIHRPVVEGRADIWVSFSPDLKHWGEYRVLIRGRHRSWDASRVGIGPSPIETPEGWLIIYHGVRVTPSGSLYRLGLALLDLDTLEVIHRSRDWVLGPRETYERVGDVGGVIFPCGAVVDEKTNELLVYYGASDSVIGLAIANLDDIISYLKACPEN